MKKPRLTPHEEIETRLKEGFDPDHFLSIWRQLNYAFGEPWQNTYTPTNSDACHFPDYPLLKLKAAEISSSRRIIQAQFISMSRVMSTLPEPEFPGRYKFDGEVCKQYWLKRAQGNHYGGNEWAPEMTRAYIDGDGVGSGFVQFGLKTNPTTGLQFQTMRHSQALHTLWDQHAVTPSDARWVAFVRYLPVDVARRLFGPEAVDKWKYTLFESGNGYGREVFRVIEYFDIAEDGGEKGTHAILAKDFGGDLLKHEENSFGCLPFAYYTHFEVPGMARPLGRIPLQMPTQEGLNELERHLRQVIKKGVGFDIVDTTQINAEDMKALYSNPEGVPFLRWSSRNPEDKLPPVVRVNSQEVAMALITLYGIQERQFAADSGTSEYERGTLPVGDHTKFELSMFEERSATGAIWSNRQVLLFYRRCIEKALYIATRFDQDPLNINVFGNPVLINDPANPNSYFHHFTTTPSEIQIGTESLDVAQANRERAERITYLKQIESWVGRTIDPIWYTEELLKAIGTKDPKEGMIGGGFQQAMGNSGQGMNPMAAMMGNPAMGGAPMPA